MAPSRSISFSGDTRTIGALMVFSTGIAIVGHEVKVSQGKSTGKVTPVNIFLGGAIGAVILTLISHAGDAGRSLGMGLAVVTFTSSVVINGQALATGITRLTTGTTGASKAAAAGTPSTPSTPSIPSTPSGVKK